MTDQIGSGFLYKDEWYSMFANRQSRLLDPSFFPREPTSRISACWDGYLARYGVRDQQLALLSVLVHLTEQKGGKEQDVKGPMMRGGIAPTFLKGGPFNNIYENLNYPLNFSGKLLLTKERKNQSNYVADFYFLWDAATAIELVFQEGQLLQEQDRTATLEQLHKELTENEERRSLQELFEWVELLFGYPYDAKI